MNTEVAANVEYAFQALALDEERKTFSPTVWESPNSGSNTRLKLLKQCWFPGVHSSVGGGYADTSISDITLAWMISQLQPLLTFDSAFILTQQQHNEQFYADVGVPVRSWGMGQIKKSDGGLLNTITGRQARTPGEYCAVDSVSGKPIDRLLTNTCEVIHPSVRYRMQQKGPGLAHSDEDPGKGIYEPQALEDWTYLPAGKPLPEGLQLDDRVNQWDRYGRWVRAHTDGRSVFIVEERIEQGTAETQLLGAWPGVAKTVLG